MTRWLGLLLLLLVALACASQDAQLSSARPAAASLSDPEDGDAAADALAAAEAEATRLLSGAHFTDAFDGLEDEEEEAEEEEEEDGDEMENEEEDDELEDDSEEAEEEEDSDDELEEQAASDAGDDELGVAQEDDEQQPSSAHSAPPRLTIRGAIFPAASVASTGADEDAAQGEGGEQAAAGAAGDSGDAVASAEEEEDDGDRSADVESIASTAMPVSDRETGEDATLGFVSDDVFDDQEDDDRRRTDEQVDDLVSRSLSGASEGAVEDPIVTSAVDGGDAAAVGLEDATCAAVGAFSCALPPVDDAAAAAAEADDEELLAVLTSSLASEGDAAEASTTLNSSGFQSVVQDLAVAVEQIVDALREGRLPHSPVSFAEAVESARARVGASASSAMAALDVCFELLVLARAKLMLLADASLERLGAWGDALARSLHSWRKQTSSAAREVATWCWEVWATVEEVRVLARNLLALALLALGALAFAGFYRAAAAVPELLLAYVLSLDDVTRAQLKIFAAALALLAVYHARVLAWVWVLALAALGFYYWSGHVVIRIEFK